MKRRTRYRLFPMPDLDDDPDFWLRHRCRTIASALRVARAVVRRTGRVVHINRVCVVGRRHSVREVCEVGYIARSATLKRRRNGRF